MFDERLATFALDHYVGPFMIMIGNLFAALAMMTSFLAVGVALKEIYQYDYDIERNIAWAFTCLLPLLVVLIDYYFLDITNFIQALSIGGSIGGGVTGILVVLMYYKAKEEGQRHPEYSLSGNKIIGISMIGIFILGMVYEILGFLGLV